MGSIDISWLNLALGCLCLIVPIGILSYFKTGLGKAALGAYARMTGQLVLVGLYLGVVFDYNSIYVNAAWVILMIVAASFTIVQRTELKKKYFLLPVMSGVIAGTVFTGAIFLFLVIGPDEFFNARYIIPITGMIIGNCLNSSIIGIRSFYKSIDKEYERYKYFLMSGADRKEALFDFMSEALKSAFGPSVASTATIGLIWLPGMMTGQILGGSDPMLAIKYQVLIVASIFAGASLTVFTSISISRKLAFDDFGMINRNVFGK